MHASDDVVCVRSTRGLGPRGTRPCSVAASRGRRTPTASQSSGAPACAMHPALVFFQAMTASLNQLLARHNACSPRPAASWPGKVRRPVLNRSVKNCRLVGHDISCGSIQRHCYSSDGNCAGERTSAPSRCPPTPWTTSGAPTRRSSSPAPTRPSPSGWSMSTGQSTSW